MDCWYYLWSLYLCFLKFGISTIRSTLIESYRSYDINPRSWKGTDTVSNNIPRMEYAQLYVTENKYACHEDIVYVVPKQSITY